MVNITKELIDEIRANENIGEWCAKHCLDKTCPWADDKDASTTNCHRGFYLIRDMVGPMTQEKYSKILGYKPEDMCKCGHLRKDHIYEEGACRSGVACSCDKFETSPKKKSVATDEQLRESQIEVYKMIDKIMAMFGDYYQNGGMKIGESEDAQKRNRDLVIKRALTAVSQNVYMSGTKVTITFTNEVIQ